MNQEQFEAFRLRMQSGQRSGPASILARVASVIIGSVVFILAIVAGGVLLMGFLALAAALAAVLGVRLWWWKRQLSKAPHATDSAGKPAGSPDAIEGEYRVVDDE